MKKKKIIARIITWTLIVTTFFCQNSIMVMANGLEQGQNQKVQSNIQDTLMEMGALDILKSISDNSGLDFTGGVTEYEVDTELNNLITPSDPSEEISEAEEFEPVSEPQDSEFYSEEIDSQKEEETEEIHKEINGTENDFSYEIINGTYASIVGYTGSEVKIVIPSEIGTYRVQSIGANAFKDSTIQEVTCSTGLINIEDYAFSGCKSLNKITFNKELKTIGVKAFDGCSALTSVDFPASVESIGNHAFNNCTNLASIGYPVNWNSVPSSSYGTQIGGVFAGCVNLTSINLPEGVMDIAAYAFYDCDYIETVTLPKTLDSISEYAFAECDRLSTVTFEDNLTSIGNYAFYGDSKISSIQIPANVKNIGNYAFAKMPSLATVEIQGNKLVSIGAYAFAEDKLLTEILIPDSVTTIRYRAFYKCTGLSSVNIPTSWDSTIGYKEDYADKNGHIFENCDNLKQVTVGAVVDLPKYAFSGCNRLEKIVLPDTLKAIPVSCFEGCSNLSDLIIPDAVISIGESAFSGCIGFSEITIPVEVITIEKSAFANMTGLSKVNINTEKLTFVGTMAFAGDSKLEKISLPDSVEDIQYHAFYNCGMLRDFTYPKNLTKSTRIQINYTNYYGSILEGCNSLRKLTFAEGATVIPDYIFNNSGALFEVVIPDSVTSIGRESFRNNKNLSQIYIGENVTTIGPDAFAGDSRLTIYGVLGSYAETYALENNINFVAGEIPGSFSLISGSVSTAEGVKLPGCSVLLFDYTNKETVETCLTDSEGKYSFSQIVMGRDYRVSVYKPGYQFEESVISLENLSQNQGDIDFSTATKLDVLAPSESWVVGKAEDFEYNRTEGVGIELIAYNGEETILEIPAKIDGYKVESLNGTFYNNDTIKKVKIPEGVSLIGENAFGKCSLLEYVELPISVGEIGPYAFEGCVALEHILFPNQLTAVGAGSFENCTNLKTVALPDSVDTIYYRAFANCSGMNQFAYPVGWKTVGAYKINYANHFGEIFNGCTSFISLEIPEGIEEIPDYAFSSANGLKNVSFPDTLKVIGKNSFNRCTGIGTLSLGEDLEEIGDYAFANATSLATVEFSGEGLTYIGRGAFLGATVLESIALPDSVETIMPEAFADCTKLSVINVPMNWKTAVATTSAISTNGDIFKGCNSLKTITVPAGKMELPNYAFKGASQLETVVLPEGLKEIPNYCFEDCLLLTNVNIPKTVNRIGKSAFAKCQSISSLSISEGVQTIGVEAFSDMVSLESVECKGTQLTVIEAKAFANCSELNTVVLPDSVEDIRHNAFLNCTKLKTINYPKNLSTSSLHQYTSYGTKYYGAIFEGCTGLNKVTFAEGTTVIANNIFEKSRIRIADLPESVETINDKAFANCEVLKSVYIGENVTTIAENAFDSCPQLTIYGKAGSYAQTYAEEHNIPFSTQVLNSEFGEIKGSVCDADEQGIEGVNVVIYDITYNEVAGTVKTDSQGDFLYEDAILGNDYKISFYSADYTFDPASVLIKGLKADASDISCVGTKLVSDYVLGAESDFDYSVLYGNRITLTAYTGAETKLEVPATIGEYVVEELDGTFANNKNIVKVKIPSGVTVVGSDTFYKCSSLQEVSLPDTLTEIGSQAFNSCGSLSEISLPNTLTTIRHNAFGYCTSLESVSFPDSLEIMEKGAFEYCAKLNHIDYPINWKETNATEANIFRECKELKTVDIPEGVKVIPQGAFAGCTYITQFTLPESLTTISSNAFKNCRAIETMAIPANVEVFGAQSFENMTALTTVTFAEQSKLTRICGYAFNGDSKLAEITLPDCVKSIEYRAFINCTSLESFYIPASWESTAGYGSYIVSQGGIFNGCEKLTSIDASKLKVLPEYAFADCDYLTTIKVSNELTCIPEYAFKGCERLTEFVIPETVTDIKNHAFDGASSITELVIPQKVKTIGTYAFANATNLGTVIFKGEELVLIGERAFSGDVSLVEMNLPDSVEDIQYRAFENCKNMVQFHYPKNCNKSTKATMTSSNGNILYGCVALRKLVIDEGATTIPDYMFANCVYFNEVSLPISLTTMGKEAFKGCNGLLEVTVCGTDLSIGANAFGQCANLEKVVIMEGAKSIGANAFDACQKLTDIYIPYTVTTIGNKIFSNMQYFVIHCGHGTAAELYAVENGYDFILDLRGGTVDGILNEETSYIRVSAADALTKGYAEIKVRYELEDDSLVNSLSDMKVKIILPDKIAPVSGSIQIDGTPALDYTYTDKMLLIPVSGKSATISMGFKPEEIKEVIASAVFYYTQNGKSGFEVIGSSSDTVDMLTLFTDREFTKKIIKVSGVAPAQTDVDVYIDNKKAGTARSDKTGKYVIQLPVENLSEHEPVQVEVKTTGDKPVSVKTTCWYEPNGCAIDKFEMYYNSNFANVVNLLDSSKYGSPISINPHHDFKFIVGISNPDKVENVVVVSKSDGVEYTIPAIYNSISGYFEAQGKFGIRNIPGSLTVRYSKKQPVLTQEEQEEEYKEKLNNSKKPIQKSMDQAQYTVSSRSITTDEYTEEKITYKFSGGETDDIDFIRDFSISCVEFKDARGIEGAKKYLDGLKFIGDTLTVAEGVADHLQFFNGIYTGELEVGSNEFNRQVCTLLIDDEKGLLILMESRKVLNEKTLGILGVVIDTVEDSLDTYFDRNEMLDKLARSNLSPDEKQQWSKDIDRYTKASTVVNLVLAGAAVAGILIGGPVGAGIAVGVVLLRYLWGKAKDNWADALLNGPTYGFPWFRWLIDPSGYVYEGVTTNRLKDVKAQIYYQDEAGKAVLWNAEEYLQQNPLMTDEEGKYAWDVLEGLWQVRFEKAGYEVAVTDWLPVLPVQTDVNIGLVSKADLKVESLNVFNDKIKLAFNQYVEPGTLEGIKLLDEAGEEIEFNLVYVEETNPQGTVFAKEYELVYKTEKTEGEKVKITIPSTVKSYTTKTLGTEYQVTRRVAVLPKLVVKETVNVKYGDVARITGSVTNFTKDMKLEVENQNASVAKIKSVTKPDASGHFSIFVESLNPGTTTLDIVVTGTDCTAKCNVLVGETTDEDVAVQKVTLTLDSEEADVVGTESVIAYVGEELSEITIPEKEGYSFAGYFTETEGKGVQYYLSDGTSARVCDLETNTILYAKWYDNMNTAVPVANIRSGSQVEKGTVITLTSASEEAVIYYTVDGTEPTVESQVYTEGIVLSGDTVIKAFAVKEGLMDSEVVTFRYTVINNSVDWDQIEDGDFDDFQDLLDVPEGIWVKGIKDTIYTGSPITFNIKVYEGCKILVEGTDYTVKYANNTKACEDLTGTKIPSVTITGKGKYKGMINVYPFRINRKDISGEEFYTITPISKFNGKKKLLVPTLMMGSKKLANKTNFTVSYDENLGYTDAGIYEVTLTGNGNYCGSRTANVEIYSGLSISSATVSKVIAQPYDEGNPVIQSEYVVTYKREALKEGTDYTVRYENNRNVGQAYMILTGMGRFAGQKVVKFKITGTALSKAVVTYEKMAVFNGRKQYPEVSLELKDGTVLRKGVDYKVSYLKNMSKGTATIQLEGMGRYTGKVKKTFKIVAASLYETERFEVSEIGSATYTGKALKPEIEVKDKVTGKKLVVGVDYTISYANTTKINDCTGKTKPTVTIKGKGNYKDKIVQNFVIAAPEIK